MSHLYRASLAARIAKLPLDIPNEDDEDEDADIDGTPSNDMALGGVGPSVLPGSGMGPPAFPRRPTPSTTHSETTPVGGQNRDSSHVRAASLRNKTIRSEFNPISASTYFRTANSVLLPSRSLEMRVYYTPPYIRKKSNVVSVDVGSGISDEAEENDEADGTVFVCHHGAGFSGLSFATFAKEVGAISSVTSSSEGSGECGVLCMDARRHGKTRYIPDQASGGEESTIGQDEPTDLSIDILVDDLVALVHTVFPNPKTSPTLMASHSMGASVITRACPKLQETKYRVGGIVVLEAVEGFALEALPHMNSLLNTRPDGFRSIQEAIEWHVKTNTIRNPIAARISVPAICIPAGHSSDSSGSGSQQPATGNSSDNASTGGPVVWRTPLRSTAPYWRGWFERLSSNFLACRTARLLVLAGTERLDKELMIGQMQGKFQLEVLPGSGHMIQEDQPTRLAEILVEFWRRNEHVVAGVKKVGDL